MTTRITATAPVRTCDCGGWTDTWFARHGAVFHVAVNPGVRVVLEARPAASALVRPVMLYAEDYGDRYAFVPGTRPWGRHPLLEAAIEAAGVPPGMAVEIRLRSAVPPGASTGTSAAVCVALVGALRALRGQTLDPGTVASAAHAVEVERLGQQSGVQDQLAAAYGGVNYVEIASYPASTVRRLPVSGAVLAALEDRLLLIYLGRTHSSSAIHEQVIRDLTSAGARGHAALEALRDAAAAARDAVLAGDLGALGAAMRANTDAQRRLHPALVGPDAQQVIAAAREHGALGWKVNGAGGEGGSIAVLCGSEIGARASVESAVTAASPSYRLIRTSIAQRGLEVLAGDAVSGADR